MLAEPRGALVAFISVLALVLSGSPAHAETPSEAFAAAECLYRKAAYEEALSAYRGCAARFPDDWRAAQARFTAGFILQRKLDRPAQAREAYAAVVKSDAAGPLAQHAEFHIAEAYEQDGDVQKAIRQYKLLLKKAVKNDRAPGVNRRLDFLDRVARGQQAEPPGWAYKIERGPWRKSQGLPPGPAEKRQRSKAVPGRNVKHRTAGPNAAPGPPAPPPEPQPQEPQPERP